MVLVVLGVLTCAVGLYDLFSKGIEDYDFTALFFGLVLISSAYFFDSAGDN